MRKERIVLATVAVSAMLAASPVGVGAGKPNLTEAERAERAVKRAERIAAAGGFVHSETQGPVIRVVSCQNRMPAKEIEKVVSDMRLLLKLHVSFEMADPMVDAASASKDKNTACYIQIIDKIGDPALTIIPEESRSRVNIAPLMEGVDIEKAAIRTPEIFALIADLGNIPERDMFNTFNMGVGMSLIVDKNDADKALSVLREMGENAYVIGEIAAAEDKIAIC